MSDDLLAELAAAERANTQNGLRECAACELIATEPEPRKSALTSALGGTIGSDRLSKILKKNGLLVSERTIRKHRAEKSTP